MKKVLYSLLITFSVLAGMLVPAKVVLASATCPSGTVHGGETRNSFAECNTEDTDGDASLMARVRVILSVVIGLIGVAAVAMIIFGAIQYVTSQGQPDKVSQARKIIIYSVIGLIVALLAFAIVQFVLGNVFGGNIDHF